MYNLDITDDFYSLFSMECAEVMPPFISIQNKFENNVLHIFLDNLIINLSDPEVYNYISNQNKNGIISKSINQLDGLHKFKDFEVMLLNSKIIFSNVKGIKYVLNNQHKEYIYELGNTHSNESHQIKIIDGKSLDFLDVNLSIEVYLSANSRINMFFRETDIVISSINFNNLLSDKIEFLKINKEELIKLKNIEFTESNIINLINN